MSRKLMNVVKNNWGYLIVAVFFLTTIGYLVIVKDNIYITVNDNLDSNVVLLKMWGDTYSGRVDGLPLVRFLGGDELLERLFPKWMIDIKQVLFLFLSPLTAYLSIWYIRIAISVVGIIYLGVVIWGRENFLMYKNFFAVAGLIYGIMPFWPMGALNFAVMPIVLALLIMIYRVGKLRYYAFLFVLTHLFLGIPIYSEFIWGYLFVFIVIDAIRNKKISIRLSFALLIWIVKDIVFTLPVIMETASGNGTRGQLIDDPFVFNLFEFIKKFINILIYGKYHSGTLQSNFLFPTITVVVLGIIIYKMAISKAKSLHNNVILLLYGTLIFNAFCQADEEAGLIFRWIKRTIPMTSAINFGRFILYSPLIIIVLMLYICILCYEDKNRFNLVSVIIDGETVVNGKNVGRWFGRAAFVFLIVSLFSMGKAFKGSSTYVMYDDFAKNIKYGTYGKLLGYRTNTLTWREYYAENLFDEIKKDIGYNNEWSVAFEIDPSVLQYNNIFTLDGYYSGASAEYKEQFSRLIKPSFYDADNLERKKHYEASGRLYVMDIYGEYSSQYGEWFWGRKQMIDKAELLIDPDVFREMNGRYIFSRVQISNARELEIRLVDKYCDSTIPYPVYVYEVE